MTQAPSAAPGPAAPYSILVSSRYQGRNIVREFTPQGNLLRTMTFNYNGGAYPQGEAIGDIVVDGNGVINAFNGDFNPLLTRYDSRTATFAHQTVAGWNGASGGIAARNNYVYVADAVKANAGAPAGIIRFDTSTGTAARFANGIDFVDLTMGLNGKLYGMYVSGRDMGVNVYDPDTMALLKHVVVSSLFETVTPRSLAVDETGHMYLCGLRNYVYKIHPDGYPVGYIDTGFYYTSDIDINGEGRLIIALRDGGVLLGDTSLTEFTLLPMSLGYSTSTFVTFSAPLPLPPPLELVRASSRKTHGTAGVFDVELPLTGAPGIESRFKVNDYADHAVVFRLSNGVVSVGRVTVAGGQWFSTQINPDRREFVAYVAGVPNQQLITVTLNDVTDVAGNFVPSVSTRMAVLRGDATGDGVVNSSDVSATKAAAAGTIGIIDSWRADVNADGVIDLADVSIVKSAAGTRFW